MPTLSIRGVSLFVKTVGEGYPLDLMRGGPGSDHTTIRPFRACPDQFTVVFYDHRCNGRSRGPDVSSMIWKNLTADAEALRTMLGFRIGEIQVPALVLAGRFDFQSPPVQVIFALIALALARLPRRPNHMKSIANWRGA